MCECWMEMSNEWAMGKISTTLQSKREYYRTETNRAKVKTVIYRLITVAEQTKDKSLCIEEIV